LQKDFSKDCFFYSTLWALQALPYASLFTFELAMASTASKRLA